MKNRLLRIIRRIPRLFLAWILATLTTIAIGVFFQTQNVISKLGDIGADVSLGERLSMTGYDIQHLGSLYGIFILAAFLIAFLMGGLVFHFAKFGRPIVYAVAGAVAILVMLFAMKANFFDIHIIAGARDMVGIGLQMLAGAIGGFVFARFSRPKEKGLNA